jgi:hypothetical protein
MSRWQMVDTWFAGAANGLADRAERLRAGARSRRHTHWRSIEHSTEPLASTRRGRDSLAKRGSISPPATRTSKSGKAAGVSACELLRPYSRTATMGRSSIATFSPRGVSRTWCVVLPARFPVASISMSAAFFSRATVVGTHFVCAPIALATRVGACHPGFVARWRRNGIAFWLRTVAVFRPTAIDRGELAIRGRDAKGAQNRSRVAATLGKSYAVGYRCGAGRGDVRP